MEDCPVSVQFRVKRTAVMVQSAGEADGGPSSGQGSENSCSI